MTDDERDSGRITVWNRFLFTSCGSFASFRLNQSIYTVFRYVLLRLFMPFNFSSHKCRIYSFIHSILPYRGSLVFRIYDSIKHGFSDSVEQRSPCYGPLSYSDGDDDSHLEPNYQHLSISPTISSPKPSHLRSRLFLSIASFTLGALLTPLHLSLLPQPSPPSPSPSPPPKTTPVPAPPFPPPEPS